MDSIKIMTRESLYDLVWSSPISKISRELGLSDKGLAKKCKKHKIPTPPLGYWAKIQSGKIAVKARLPECIDPLLDKVIFYPKAEVSTASRESKVALNENELERALKYTFPKRVQNHHSILKDAKKASKQELDKYGRVHWFSIKTTPTQLNRACLFLEGLIRLFDTYGWEAKSKEAKYQTHGDFYFTNGSEEIFFEITEAVKQVDHVKNESDSRFWSPRYDYLPTKMLELRITNLYRAGFKLTWKDSSKHSIESQVLSIAESFSRAFDFERLNEIHKEQEREKWRKEQERRRELEKLNETEKARIDHLLLQADNYQKAESIYSLVNALSSSKDEPGLHDWLRWAEQVAESIDPVKKVGKLLQTHQKLSDE